MQIENNEEIIIDKPQDDKIDINSLDYSRKYYSHGIEMHLRTIKYIIISLISIAVTLAAMEYYNIRNIQNAQREIRTQTGIISK